MNANTAMAPDFGIRDILMTYPPLVEAQGKTHGAKRNIRHERDSHHVEKLLLMVAIGREEWVGMLR